MATMEDTSLGVKRPVCEADHSPPPSAEVKTVWSYNSTPSYVFMAWRLVERTDKFTFTLPGPSQRDINYNFQILCKETSLKLSGLQKA